jgi:hypothetical protein
VRRGSAGQAMYVFEMLEAKRGRIFRVKKERKTEGKKKTEKKPTLIRTCDLYDFGVDIFVGGNGDFAVVIDCTK